MKDVIVVGVGLIGSSLALDIKTKYPEVNIFGVDHNEDNLIEAKALGVIDDITSIDSLPDAELIIISIPVDATLKLLPSVLDRVGDDTLVIDVGSTKEDICLAVKDHKNRRNFLATHPIAGTEFSGPSAAIQGLFSNKTNIICEVEQTAFKLQEKALELFKELGMRIRYMNPEAHDKHIAYVSHLSHISSFMLGKTVIEKEKNERDIFDMAGSGFESTVRLAKSSPAMWTPIFKQNKDNVLETLEGYIANLIHFKELIKNDDYEGVYNDMASTNHIGKILNGIQLT